jgi:glycosyltransferase involved in cell wall biosynthesis
VIRTLAWVPEGYNTSPGQRYRIEQWEPWLRGEGIEIHYSAFSDASLARSLKRPGRFLQKAFGVARGLARRAADLRRAKAFDLVYVFREGSLMGPALAERVLARRGIPVLFDFDDAVWIRYVSPANAYFSYLRFPGKTATLCRLAHHVIAGNRYLAEYATRYNPAVTIVPSTIDTTKYAFRGQRAIGSRPVIGWTGSYSTGQYLRLVKSALERLRKRHDFRFVVIGPVDFQADGVEVEQRPWHSESEVQDLLDLDVGLMPVPDAEWERGKCGLKALQYMALGIPPVVSPVGVNSTIVEDGRNGFLASTEDEWVERLDRLLSSAELRNRIAREARRTVEREYSAQVQGPRVATIMRETAERFRP